MPALAYATVDAVIPVSGLYVKDTPSHAYEIRIEPENEYAPAPVSDTLTVMENGTGYFEINITEPGTFRYTVYELAGDDPAIAYDSNIYHITLFVETNEKTS